jgi:NTE family protein
MSVAFVLSGGASLGSMQAGMLRALYERSIEPDVIVGTSVGAINGAFLASRPQSPDTAAQLADVWRSVRRPEVFPFSPVTALVGFAGKRNYSVPNRALRRLIADQLEFERLEDAAIPLHVIAVDLFSGRERRLSRGPALDAVLASASIPGVFPPVEWEDTELIDGGVANNTPISHAVELGCDEIYVLPTGTACALPEAPHGSLGMAVHAMSLLVQQRLVADIKRFSHDARLVVLPPPCPVSTQPTDFSRSDGLIQQGYDEAVAALAKAAAKANGGRRRKTRTRSVANTVTRPRLEERTHGHTVFR